MESTCELGVGLFKRDHAKIMPPLVVALSRTSASRVMVTPSPSGLPLLIRACRSARMNVKPSRGSISGHSRNRNHGDGVDLLRVENLGTFVYRRLLGNLRQRDFGTRVVVE